MSDAVVRGVTAGLDRFRHQDPDHSVYRVKKGLSREVVEDISYQKGEPVWMREFRLKSLEIFQSKPLPTWGPDLSGIDFDALTYFIRPTDEIKPSWDDLPAEMKETFAKLKIPEAEQKMLAGVVAMYDSETVYQSLQRPWEKQGVIFCDMDTALKEHEELVRKYFMTKCVPRHDNKFSALHGAVWSGGSFLYVPAGVKVKMPLQTYFRMNASGQGQFEHTLIIVEEGAEVHYIEGCTAPLYSRASLHSAVVEIFVGKGARSRYTTVQNWSKNVYNLNTKRAIIQEDAHHEWVGGSLGSGVTMLYPASWLVGRGASCEHLNIALAVGKVDKDTGAKVIHGAPDTKSRVVAKSISKDGGRGAYRGLLKIVKGAARATANIQCDALIMDERSVSDTLPHIEISEDTVTVAHEATVGRIGQEQLFYLMSRGLTEEEAISMIVSGFLEPVVKELPLEYAVELNRLIQLEMEGSVG
jgi:Fe-S cluster assembly protein SufB